MTNFEAFLTFIGFACLACLVVFALSFGSLG